MRILLVFFLAPFLFADQSSLRHLEAKITLRDFNGALQDVEKSLKETPENQELLKLKLNLLAKMSFEKPLLETFKEYLHQVKEPYKDRDLLESVAFGVIGEGIESRSPEVRFHALLAAHQSRLAKGVQMICQALKDPHALIRALACQLSGTLQDQCLKEKVFKTFLEDSDFRVHLEALRSLGQMKCHFAKEALVSLVSDPKRSAEERAVALEALVTLTEGITDTQLKSLVSSNRLGFRLLACRLAEWFDGEVDPKLLFPLLKDPFVDVRCGAAHALGIRKVGRDEVLPLLLDQDLKVSVIASWALAVMGDSEGLNLLVERVSHPKKEIRSLAATALASTGVKGELALLETFNKTADFFPKLNLALGLMRSQKNLDEVGSFLFEALTQQTPLLMKKEEASFEVFIEGTSKELLSSFETLETIDQRTRFELLNDLALLDPNRALKAARVFLKQKKGAFTAEVSALFLTEGDEAAQEVIEGLLTDEDPDVRLESALILAFWGKEAKILPLLEKAYEGANGPTKKRILQATGQLGMMDAVPFLVKSLFEPHQTLRLVAASAILSSLTN